MENTMKRTVIESLALVVGAIQNCKKSNNTEWEQNHTEKLEQVVSEYLPHGSGLDGIVEVDIDKSSENKVVINIEYHHMDENGFYSGWTNHSIICTPSFIHGVDIRVTGVNKNDIKSYLEERFAEHLQRELN
jgi:hypothetical protein